MTNRIEKDLICIVCPNGCRLHGQISEEGELTVTGNRCKRGIEFAGAELTNPVRSLTTTVKTVFEEMPYLPVRTAGEIPKQVIHNALEELRSLCIREKVGCGDIVLENLAGTGINVIAATDLE